MKPGVSLTKAGVSHLACVTNADVNHQACLAKVGVSHNLTLRRLFKSPSMSDEGWC
jgi:hypothetical protein